MLLVLAVTASGLLHAAGGDHSAHAAVHSHEQASDGQDAGDENCGPEHRGEPHGTTCSVASDCSFWMPVAASARAHRSDAGPSEIRPEAIHSGIILFPQFRPSRLLPDV